MKTKLLLLSALFLGFAFTLQSCNDDDTMSNPGNPAIESAFMAKYPAATGVGWKMKDTYYVAGFWQNNQQREAWFSRDGSWHYTETDIPYNLLPEPVKAAFTQSEYSTWRIDDIDMVERNGMETVYVIEVEQNKQEYDLYYSPSGTLVKAVADNGDGNGNGYLPTGLPEKASSYLTATYPSARIVEIDIENGGYEVDIVNNGKRLEVQFTMAGDWRHTKTEDLRQADVPASILAIVQASYSGYKIDDIDYYETPTGNFYLFELEMGSKEINVRISDNGTIL